MPRSRTRHKHHHHHHHPKSAQQQQVMHKPKRRSAVPIMIVFIALLGVVIAFISVGSVTGWLLTGAVAGGIVGYFIGHSMDKVAARSKS